MRRLKKVLTLFIAGVILTQGSVFPAFAVEVQCVHGNRTFMDHKLTGGVGNFGNYRRYYWVSSSTNADKQMIQNFRNTTDNIGNAVDYWVNTSPGYPNVKTSISFRETSVKSQASVEIAGNFLGESHGRTQHMYYNDIVQPAERDWGWCIIYINPNAAAELTERGETGLIGHEFGHAMGLSHQDRSSMRTKSIMYPLATRKMEDGSTDRNRPGTVDCNNIKHIYE